ncbi:glycosyltransferase [Pseudonocardia petroleophila]|uniref:Glycosyl transferase n=1 Tax=Pseudonocardia petroleophila TaxID=37331 RepID=A0A7G7MJI8_9PSEU|nr:macrolide family glycosyltransferase [Pseudonocardia petroleophila]QNG52949.1 glycosyl transferase [Pseudonocardia petroleophila]
MSHIAMVAPPAHGHVNPSLPVVAELVARGHRVSYAVPAPFADTVAGAGATPVVHATLMPDETAGEQWPSEPVAGMRLFLDEGIASTPLLRAAFDGDRPDLFLADIGGYSARVLAHRWDRPLVQLSPARVAWEGYESDPEIVTMTAGMRDDPAVAAYREDFAAWLAAEGVPLDVDAFTGRPPRSLVLLPRAMQPHADLVDEQRYTFVGPCLDRRPHQGDWPASERPLVLVSLGSAYTDVPDFYRACFAAFGDLDRDVVVQVGAHVDLDELGPVPANTRVERWVPQLAVLGRASAFVTHAGMGGCSEGLWQGVPMVAVPQAVDQFGNAARLAELGVARHLPAGDVTPAALREALLSLDDPAVRARSAALRDELRAAGGTTRAADLIEAELR